VRNLLQTNGAVVEDDAAFPNAVYDEDAALPLDLAAAVNISKHGELLDLVGKELALRVCTGNPQRHTKEASRRELISPLLFAAALLSGWYCLVVMYMQS
jgi:hypothetical protein